MKIDYDPGTDSLYIHLSDRPSVDSEEVTDNVVLDWDEEGSLVGIDVQHASRQSDLATLSLNKLPLSHIDAA